MSGAGEEAGPRRFHDSAQLLARTVYIQDDYLPPQIAAVVAEIGAQNELRFFVDGTLNLGHQASTIGLLKRVVERAAFSGKVVVVYADYGEYGLGSAAEKLALLLPGFDPTGSSDCRLEGGSGTRLEFLNFENRRALDTRIAFGFTGGADDMSINLAAELNVEYFVRLQPYGWDDDASRKTDPAYESSRIETPDGAFFYLVDAYPDFRRLAFKAPHRPSQAVSHDVWRWYAEQRFDADLRIRTGNARALGDPYAKGRSALYWPVYGLHHFKARAAELALALVLTALKAQARAGRPIVISSFSPPARAALWSELLAPLGHDLNTRSDNLPSFRKALREKVSREISDGQPLSQVKADELADKIADEVRPWIGVGSCVTLLSGYDAVEGRSVDVSGPLAARIVRAGRNEVIVASIGTVPMEIFNAHYESCDMPGIVEGQASAGFLMSLGKAFLQLPRSGTERRSRPLPRGAPHAAMDGHAAQVARHLAQGFTPYLTAEGSRDAAEFVVGIAAAAEFLLAAGACESTVSEHFARVGQYSQKDIHDKLMIGLLGLHDLVPEWFGKAAGC